ncbi:MAG: RNA polymerase sigma factor [Rhodanobacter sp.]|nr:MAG: RNA polymerase sigma factor [Rhodanobacter sp.]TAM38534.1 MAG: RNA polymerase sigma factor [Rhodanobacter sp.]
MRPRTCYITIMLTLRHGLAQTDRITSDATSVAGDAPFVGLLEDLIPGLRRHLQRQLGSADAADDAVQETCLRMLRYRGIGDAGEVRALLFHVASSVVADRWRRAKVQHSKDHCSLDGQELVSSEPQPDRLLAGRQDLGLIKQAIRTLPPRCREVFVLHRFEGLSYRDIARRFGTSERTVENQIAHALAVCRCAIGEHRGRTFK